MNYLKDLESELIFDPNIKEKGLMIQVSIDEFKFYYDSIKKQLFEYGSNNILIAESKTQELELYSGLLDEVTLLIEKTRESIQSATHNMNQGLLGKINSEEDFEARSWLKYIYALEVSNLNPCLKIRNNVENKIQELTLEIEVEEFKIIAKEKVQHHLKELIPLLDTITIDFFKEAYKLENNNNCEVGIRNNHFTKKTKGKLAVTCSKLLYNRIGNKLLSIVPVVHGKTYIQKEDKLSLEITEFLTYKRFSHGELEFLDIISETIESYENKWNIDLEETIKQDRVITKTTATQ